MSAEIIGWIASAVFLVRLLPQPLRLARTGVPDGVSPMSAMNAGISDLGWFLYGIGAGSVPVWLVAVVALVPNLWTSWLLRDKATGRDVIGSTVWLAVIFGAWATGSLVFVLAGTVLVCQGPQVWTSLRSRDLGGIAVATWYIAIADALLWGGYGVARMDFALIGYGIVLMTSALIIITRVRITRRAEPVTAPAYA